MRALIIIAACLCSSFALGWTHGNGQPNLNSPLGSNTIEVSASTPEHPFLNIFKTGTGWYTSKSGSPDTGDEIAAYANCLNSNHFLSVDPATCATNFGTSFTFLATFVNRFVDYTTPTAYPSGNYVLLWDGNGNSPTTMFQANKNGLADTPASTTSCPISGFPNRILYSYSSPTTNGQEIDQTTIGTGGTPPNNIRFVYSPDSTCGAAGTNEQLLASAPNCSAVGQNTGGIFDPTYLSKMQYFNPIRFMKWEQIISNPITSWAQRSLPCWAFWDEGGTQVSSTTNPLDIGVPYEIQIALANKLGADGWFNVPFLFTQSAMQSLAALVHSNLRSNLKAYEEEGNEWWNVTPQTVNAGIYAAGGALGNAAYPCAGNALPTDACPTPNPGSAFQQWFNFGILQQVRSAQAWQTAWGADFGRVITIGGAQTGSPGQEGSVQYVLGFQDSYYGGAGTNWSGAVSTQVKLGTTAPYWPGFCPRAWTGDSDGGISRCITELRAGGLLSETPNTVNTTTHTTSSGNACSVATGLSANHYVVASGSSYGSFSNGMPVGLKFDVNTAGPCDDLNVDSLGAVLLQQDPDIIIQDQGVGGAANISGTTLTVTNNSNLPQCCSLALAIGASVNGGTTAGTFVVNYLTGSLQDTITASIASTKVMTVSATGGSNVQVGFLVVGGSVAASTLVTGNSSSGATACNGSPCTGSGGIGTYAVSVSQTVGSTAGLSVESPGFSGTYKVNLAQTVTCNPCTASVPITANFTGTSNPWAAVFTNATSLGSMTQSWRLQCPGVQCDGYPGGWIAQELLFLSADITVVTGPPYNLLYGAYEAGQNFVALSNADELATLYVSMNRSASMGLAYTQWFNALRGAGLNGPLANFTAISGVAGTTGFRGENWGLLEDSRQSSSPKYGAAVTYIQQTACWWIGCNP